MKAITVALSLSVLTMVMASSFASDAYAVRRGAMSGYDNTYGSTGRCHGGDCKLRTPKAMKKPVAHQS
jgi:hypothetical protein